VPIDLEPGALHNRDALTDQWRSLAEHSGALRLLRLFDEAIEAGRRAAQSAPASWEAQWALVQALAAAGQRAQAERVANDCASASKHRRMKAIPAKLTALCERATALTARAAAAHDDPRSRP
jgi:hypothetical protein